MSYQHNRSNGAFGPDEPTWNAASALAEAQAILAESEPTELVPVYSPAYSFPVDYERVSLGQVAPLDSLRISHQALAEAIARALDAGAFDEAGQ